MYRSYTKFFRIFGCVNKFLQNWKIAALFKNQKLEKLSVLSLSLTGWPHPLVTHTRARRRCPTPTGQFAPSASAPAIRLASTRSTSHGGPISTLIPVAGTPEKVSRWPWRLWRWTRGGARWNTDYNMVASKAKGLTRLGTHHQHVDVLGEDGDALE